MSAKQRSRAELLDLVLEKHEAGALKWDKREGEDSYEVSIGGFKIHIDRRLAGQRPYFIVWVFEGGGIVVDRFDTDDEPDIPPGDERFDSYAALARFIYREVDDKSTVDKLDGIIKSLKEIDSPSR